VTLGNLELAVEDYVKRVARVALLQHQLSCGDGDRFGHLKQLLQILLGEVGQEGNVAYFVKHHRALHPAEIRVDKLHGRRTVSGR
jgi:hypothetical protein